MDLKTFGIHDHRPHSSYSCFVMHVWWKVVNEVMMELPIQAVTCKSSNRGLVNFGQCRGWSTPGRSGTISSGIHTT